MQLFPPQPLHYLPLPAILLLHLAGASLPHLALLSFQILLRPTTTQNYCNAAVSIMLTPLLLLLNLYDASRILLGYSWPQPSHSSSQWLQMQASVWLDLSFWVLLSEAVCLLLYMRSCWARYKEYRAEIVI